MCDALSDIRATFESLAEDFDARTFAASDLEAALGHAGAIEKIAASLGSMVAAHLAKVGKASRARREAARRFARASGTSVKAADKAIGTAQQMASQPDVDAAARRGQLSRQQAAIVSDAAAANPGATPSLLDKANSSSLSELADAAARAKAAVSDPECHRQEVHKARSLRSYTDSSGVWHMHAQGLPEDGAKIMAALQPISDKLFEQARKEGRREPPEAYAFDALVGMATSGGGGAPAAEVVFRIDVEAFFRGYPTDGEVIEVAGFGPTSAQAVRDILRHGTPFLKAVITKGKDVVGVVHLGRRPNAYQKTALDWLFPTCAAEGCGVRTDWCETDHREPWAQTHFTVLQLLDRLCKTHHKMKTNEGWSLAEGEGKRPFVPPNDPRHPRFARPCAGPPPQPRARPCDLTTTTGPRETRAG